MRICLYRKGKFEYNFKLYYPHIIENVMWDINLYLKSEW